MPKHKAFYISNTENKKQLLNRITSGEWLKDLDILQGVVFSDFTLNKFIDEEMRHGHFDVQTSTKNSLKNSSEGERKRALINHILKSNPEYIVLDNVFDCLDAEIQSKIENTLTELSKHILIIQITTRKRDILAFIDDVFMLEDGEPKLFVATTETDKESSKTFTQDLPQPYDLERKLLTL